MYSITLSQPLDVVAGNDRTYSVSTIFLPWEHSSEFEYALVRNTEGVYFLAEYYDHYWKGSNETGWTLMPEVPTVRCIGLGYTDPDAALTAFMAWDWVQTALERLNTDWIHEALS